MAQAFYEDIAFWKRKQTITMKKNKQKSKNKTKEESKGRFMVTVHCDGWRFIIFICLGCFPFILHSV